MQEAIQMQPTPNMQKILDILIAQVGMLRSPLLLKALCMATSL